MKPIYRKSLKDAWTILNNPNSTSNDKAFAHDIIKTVRRKVKVVRLGSV